MTDRGYTSLLSHLNKSSTNLPLATFQVSVAHYLAHIQPTPTPFAATVISSPYFRSFNHPKLEALSTAFRHALHFKIKLIKKESTGMFSRSVRGRLGEWVIAVLKGLQGGEEILRLACCNGLLLGLGDWEGELAAKEIKFRVRVEEELVVALAEVMELHPYISPSGWESEFKQGSSVNRANVLSSALLLVSNSCSLVASPRLKALPLRGLTNSIMVTIEGAFQSGSFLATLPKSISKTQDDKLSIDPDSDFAKNIGQLMASPIISSMAPLSRVCAQTISVLTESKPQQGWLSMSETMQRLERLTLAVERDWLRSPLAAIDDQDDIAPESRGLAINMWNVLKTMLFTTIMIVQSVLTTLVYVPQPSSSSSVPSSEQSNPLGSPYSFALTSLHIFSHLSFILPQFGGVASTSEGGLPELKKVFYTALDILSADQEDGKRFVKELKDEMDVLEKGGSLPSHFIYAKKAYALACIEQLVAVLDDDSIRNHVFPMCEPHLSDPSHRETYESAHSVMLAIFSLAQKVADGEFNTNNATSSPTTTTTPFVEQIVPFYTRCLIENSADGCLNTTQLCLAYAALVRSAGSFGVIKLKSHSSSSSSTSSPPLSSGDAFSLFCIDSLLQAISSVSTSRHVHRLHLTLISTVRAVSLPLLPTLLTEIKRIIVNEKNEERKEELVKALFKEVLENVGDLEKESVMKWWFDNRSAFDRIGGRDVVEEAGKGKGRAAESVARL
ncbi:hypothetical protein ABKN59_010246 [Abortiporus biennis]